MRNEVQVFDIPFPDTTDIERQVIADAVTSDYMFGDVLPLVHVDFFTTTVRKKMWETIIAQYNAGKGITMDIIGPMIGKAFFDEILPKTNFSGGVMAPIEHARLLRDGNAKRRAYFAAATFLQNSTQPQCTEQDILTNIELFTRTIEGPAPLMSEKRLSSVLEDVRAEAKKTQENRDKGRQSRITTGFDYMNRVFYGGFKPGQLIILAARPSVGKTAVMLQMAKAAALAGNPVQVFSLEMTAQELGERLLFSTGKVLPKQISTGCVEWQAYTQAENELKSMALYINDFSRTLDEIVSRLTQAVKQNRCKIAFIDYLGLLQDCLSFGNAKLYQVIAKVTGTLKAVAKRLEIPIVLLCQMNREQAKEKRSPELYDLRDSGSIEQDADIVLMLEPKMENTTKQIFAWLRKHRSGMRDIAFILEPNETYSSFTEQAPQLIGSGTMPEEPNPTQGDIFKNDEEDLPF